MEAMELEGKSSASNKENEKDEETKEIFWSHWHTRKNYDMLKHILIGSKEVDNCAKT